MKLTISSPCNNKISVNFEQLDSRGVIRTRLLAALEPTLQWDDNQWAHGRNIGKILLNIYDHFDLACLKPGHYGVRYGDIVMGTITIEGTLVWTTQMNIFSMRVACHAGSSLLLYFDVPKNQPFDLKNAWLRNCGTKKYNNVVRECDSLNKFHREGTNFPVFNGAQEKIGTIIVKPLVVHSTVIPPSYEVYFQLRSGVYWTDIFECRIEDLVARIQEKLSNSACHSTNQKELQEAAAVFELGPMGPGFERAVCQLQYAGVNIGTITVKKIQ